MFGYRKNVSIFSLLCFLPLGFALTVHAQATSGAAFLKNSATPAAYAMGNSGVVTSWGSQAADANPANLSLMSRRMELFTSYQSLSGGIQHGHLAAAIAMPSSSFLPDALGLSVIRRQLSGMEATDALDNTTGSLGAGDTALGLSASKRIGSLGLGVTGKAIQSQIAGYKSNTALAADMGLNYTLRQFHGLSLGAGINNLGQGVRFLDQTDALPTSVNFGAALPVGQALGVVTVSRMVHEQKTNVGVGMSYGMGPVELRGGYMAQQGAGTNLAARDQSGLAQMMGQISGGLGIRMGETAKLDYAVSQGATELGATQRLALTLQWGDRNVESGKAAKAGNRSNTRMTNSSSTPQGNPDTIDWHMINMQDKP